MFYISLESTNQSSFGDCFVYSEPTTAGQLPDEFDQREPPIMFLPPFENSKDSPVLIAMQGEAQQQQLAALLKTKTF